MIEVRFNNGSVEELHAEMTALLFGRPANVSAGTGGSVGTSNTTAPAEADKPARGGRRSKASETTGQAISTGEERVDPDTAKQDAADEAADTAKEKAAEPKKLTHDDVKRMMSGYAQAYGMEAAQADGGAFINAKMISSIPDEQEALAKAIIGIAKGFENNPNKRDMTGEVTPEKMAEMKAIVQAAQAVTGK